MVVRSRTLRISVSGHSAGSRLSIFGSIFGRFSAKLGPKTLGSSCSAVCTKNQARRPTLRPKLDSQLLPGRVPLWKTHKRKNTFFKNGDRCFTGGSRPQGPRLRLIPDDPGSEGNLLVFFLYTYPTLGAPQRAWPPTVDSALIRGTQHMGRTWQPLSTPCGGRDNLWGL